MSLARSSCVILLAPGATPHDEPRIWLARRVQSSPFLGGFHAFIGGAIEPEDGASDEAWRACAARELYEELGVMFTRSRGMWCEQSLEDVGCAERLELMNESLDLERYLSVGRWATPSWAPLRFETEFFLIALSVDEANRLESHDASAMLRRAKLEAPAWRTTAQWLRLHEYGEVLWTLPTIEYMRELHEHAPRLLADAPTRLMWRHDERDVLDALRQYAHTANTWMVPLKSPTLLPATHTNCYIVGDAQSFVVIDPGAEDHESLAPLCKVIDALRALGSACEAIILTHHHPDHISGITLLATHYGEAWPVWAHALTTTLLPSHQVPQGVARALVDGELLSVSAAHTLEVLFTPGHAPGHVALWHRESRAVFCGDLVASQGTILVAPPRGHMGDYLASLSRMRDLAPSSLHPAHGWPVRDAKAHLTHYISHRHQREQRVLAALERHPGAGLRAIDLVSEVYQDVPEQVWPIAAMSLEAHLVHLSEQHPHISRTSERDDFPGEFCYRAPD